MLLDFSTTGWQAAAKEFFGSLIKTMLATGIAYALTKLASYQVPITTEYAAEIIAVIGVIRAVLTSLATWLTTTGIAPALDTVPAS